MDYVFEKVTGEEIYQVRLRGEFVAYTKIPTPEHMDKMLLESGYPTREAYYNESITMNLSKIK